MSLRADSGSIKSHAGFPAALTTRLATLSGELKKHWRNLADGHGRFSRSFIGLKDELKQKERQGIKTGGINIGEGK